MKSPYLGRSDNSPLNTPAARAALQHLLDVLILEGAQVDNLLLLADVQKTHGGGAAAYHGCNCFGCSVKLMAAASMAIRDHGSNTGTPDTDVTEDMMAKALTAMAKVH